MARQTFGGRLEQVGATVATDLSLKLAAGATMPALYDKPKEDGTRVVVTDFLVDSNGDGTFDQATSTIVVDASGIPPFFQGPDGLTSLYDFAGHRLKANDADTSGAPPASTTVAGVVELDTSAEGVTGTDTTRAMTAAATKAVMDAHLSAATPHQAYSDAINDLLAANALKADLTPGVLTVPMTELPQAVGAVPDTMVTREAVTAAIQVGPASADNHAMQRLQVLAAIAAGTATGATVRSLNASGLPLSSTTSASYTTIPGMNVTDAASGQVWAADLWLVARGNSAQGIQIRQKLGSATITNKLANPSFETNVLNWTPANANVTIARATAGGAQDGTAYMTMTVVNTASVNVYSDFVPATVGSTWSSGGYVRLGTGTGHLFSVDIQYADAAGTVLATDLAAGTTPVGGSWTRNTNGVTTQTFAPTGTTQARVRLRYPSATAGDVIHVDAVQLENVFPLPAYGNTGGSGTTALGIRGDYGPNLIVASATQDDYRRVTPIRYTGSENLIHQSGLLGTTTDSIVRGFFMITVGGTGLDNQRIEWEFAQIATNATATQIVDGSATFVRML